jgi:hypothetical protein
MKRNLLYVVLFLFISCSGDTQKGQAVGFITHFTRAGVIWKSWDMELNKSQTGMTSTAQELNMSIDNDNEDQNLVNELDSAQKYGWKVQVDYQQNFGNNVCNNRGGSSMFVKSVVVLDKNPIGDKFGNPANATQYNPHHDTTYVIILNK